MSIVTLDFNTINSISDPIVDKSDLKLYPNPNNGKFNIEIQTQNNADLSCEVINPLGKVIYIDQYLNTSGSVTKTIDLGNIEKGMYIIKITGKNTFITKQLIIQ
jgi:hypothetical protein